MIRPAQRRLVFLTAAFALSLLSCGREVTGPHNAIDFGRRTAALALDPQMPDLFAELGGSAVVPFERVRAVLRNSEGAVVLDTMIAFPSGADSLAVTLAVPLPLNTPESGLPVVLSLAYINTQGDTIFRAGPTNTVAVPVATGGTVAPITLPVRYDGVGANANAVAITPDSADAVAGETTIFAAEALDGQGTAIAGTPLLFYTLDSTRAQLLGPGSGQVTWLPVRGLARIVAALPDGARADTAFVTVSLPASRLELVSGDEQTGTIGANLAAPIVLRTVASDAVPVEGVDVTFAITSGAGSLDVLTATSDANGEVSVQWTLGTALGPQSITATAEGLTGSPLTLTATGAPGAPVLVESVAGGGQTAAAGAALAELVSVRVLDALGNPVPGVTVTWDGIDGASNFSDPTGVTDAAGIVTTTVTAALAAGERSFAASADGVAEPIVFEVLITAAAPHTFVLTEAPAAGAAGVVLAAFRARAEDEYGNPVLDFADSAEIVIDSGPPDATLGGTTRVEAVAGIVSFDDLALTTAGTYRLRVEWPGILPSASGDFDIVPAAAALIALLDGDGQAGALGTLTAAPLRVLVTDAFGNGVAGVSVDWTSADESATPTDATVLTDADGIAGTTALLGTVAGPAQVSAAAVGLAGSPVQFSLTITAGAAAQLTVETEPTAETIAGETLAPIVVAALDAQGNVAADFAGTVTVAIDVGVGGAVLGGVLEAVAVAGVATFDQLVLETRGAYVLRFTSPGLTDTTSAAFDIVPAAAFEMQLLDGDAQSDTVGFALPLPLRVVVVDAFGNGVSNQAVAWTITSGAGVLAADTVLTDVDGFSQGQLTLGTTAGAVTVEATIDGLSGSPVVFTSTAIPAFPAVLVLTSAPTLVDAGSVADPIVLEMRDAFGNVVTWFTEDATITANDAPGDFDSGTTTRAAAAGVITFDDLVLSALGGWFIEVASGGLSAGVDLEVVIGPPSLFSIVSGNAQVGFVPQLLSEPLVVRLTDLAGNPMVGEPVAFVVSVGSGTLSSDSALDSVLTNASGEAMTSWTLGLEVGTQEVRATYGVLDELVFTALGEEPAAERNWTNGSGDQNWFNAANWAEGFVPTAADSVFIELFGGSAAAPIIGANAAVRALVTTDGGAIQTEFELTVTHSLSVTSGSPGIVCTGLGSLVLAAATELLASGYVDCPVRVTSGRVALEGAFEARSVFVEGSGELDVGGWSLDVVDLHTSDAGTLRMDFPAGPIVTVAGEARFEGGSTAGMLTEGTLVLLGSFTQGVNPAAYQPGPEHTTYFGGASDQNVVFEHPDSTSAGSFFGNVAVGLTFSETSVVLGSDIYALGSLSIGEGTQRAFSTTLPEAPLVFSRGASLNNFTFTNVRLHIADGSLLDSPLNNVRFEAMNIAGTSPPQLTIARSTGALTLSAIEFDTLSTADYLGVSDPDGAAGGLFAITMTSPIPAFHSGRIQTDGFATINNWDQDPTFTWTGAVNTAWTDAGNWSSGVVPGASSEVLIPGGAPLYPVVVDEILTIGGLTMEVGSSLSLTNTPLLVTNSLSVDEGATLTGDENSPVQLTGSGSVRGTLPSLYVNATGPYATTAPLTILGDLGILAGSLGGGALPIDVGGSMVVAGTGTLLQTAGGTVTVEGDVTFGGANSAGNLTFGTLRVGGSFVVSGADGSGAFAPGPSHLTDFFSPELPGENTIFFLDTTTSAFGTVQISGGDRELLTPVRSIASFDLFEGIALTASGAGSLDVGNHLGGGSSSSLVVPRVSVNGAFLFGGTYTVDTTYFTGTDQVIPSLVAGNAVVFGSVVVTGTATMAYNSTEEVLDIAQSLIVRDAGVLQFGDVGASTVVDIAGDLITEGDGSIRMEHPNTEVNVLGSANFGGGLMDGSITDGRLVVTGNFTQSGSGARFAAEGAHVTELRGAASTVTFNDPGESPAGSHFNDVLLAQPSGVDQVTLASDVWMLGELRVAALTPQGRLVSDGATTRQVFSRGGAVPNFLAFVNTVWTIADGRALFDLNGVSFTGIAGAFDQLTITRDTGVVALVNPTFDASAAGNFLVADDTEPGSTTDLTIAVSGATPEFHLGRAIASGAATITGWEQDPEFIWTGAVDNVWNNTANWSDGVVPTTTSIVGIPVDVPLTPLIPDGTTLQALGAETVLPIVVDGTLTLTGDLFVPIDDGAGLSCLQASRVRFEAGDPPAEFRGRFACLVEVASGSAMVSSTVYAEAVLVSGTGLLVMGGGVMDVLTNFNTIEGGRLQMTDAADRLNVLGAAGFSGGSTSGLLTAGELNVFGSITQTGDATSLDATGSHLTIISEPSLPGEPALSFTSPLTSGFGQLEFRAPRTVLQSVVPARGNATLVGTIEVAEVSGLGALYVGGDLVGVDEFSELFLPRLGLGGLLAYNGVFDVDSIEFTGSGQSIAGQPNAQTPSWQHIIVSGTVTFGGAALSVASLGSLTITSGGELAILDGGSIDLFSIPVTAELGGTLRVATGGTFRSRAHSEIEGALVIESGASAFFNAGGLDGQHLFPAGSAVSGAGTFDVNGANLVEVAGAFDVGALQLQNATLAFNGADTAFVGGGAYAGGGFLNGTGVIGIRGAFSSTGGNPEGTGTIAVLPGGTLTWSSPLRGWNLDIAGTMVWGDWDLSLEQFGGLDPAITIRSGGLLDIQHGGLLRNMFANSANVITNFGSIVKSTGTANTLIRAQVVHSGFMDALSGELSFQFACVDNGGTFGTGAGTITNCAP